MKWYMVRPMKKTTASKLQKNDHISCYVPIPGGRQDVIERVIFARKHGKDKMFVRTQYHDHHWPKDHEVNVA